MKVDSDAARQASRLLRTHKFKMMDDVADQEHAVRNLVLSVCDLKQNGECPPERVLGQAVTVGTRM